MTATEQEIERLRRQLGREAGGPVAEISNQATHALVSIAGAVVTTLRQSVEERPLIGLLLAFENGFAVGRWGGRRHVALIR
jgi:hypothetical protein